MSPSWDVHSDYQKAVTGTQPPKPHQAQQSIISLGLKRKWIVPQIQIRLNSRF